MRGFNSAWDSRGSGFASNAENFGKREHLNTRNVLLQACAGLQGTVAKEGAKCHFWCMTAHVLRVRG